ncbi:uncharacterized protein LOC116416682 [Nasonia vitripennis]|uniref:ZSWIM1/3 RNaseH-like domain-containing protein n=1 Tax=Nasonia vitripennis TaxID=7425 RepID=A0A7M7T871_NASVI|nr:uncharacterized protein LOC116416682 [Nasonia vitripennis]
MLNTKGIHLTAKDVQNFNQNLKAKDDDALNSFVKLLRNKYHATVDVSYEVRDYLGVRKKVFQSLFFTTEKMKQDFAAWPEMIFVDTTYNLFKRKLPLLLLCVRDTMGLAHIIGVGLLANEQKETLRSLFENLKK